MGRIPTGYIRRTPANTWQVSVSVTDPLTGKRTRRTRTVPTKREALSLRAKMLGAGTRGRSDTRTVGDLADLWLEHNSDEWTDSQSVTARGHVENHIRPALGHLRLNHLETQDLDSFYKALRKKPKSLSAPTVRRVHASLSSMLSFAKRRKWMDENPTTDVLLPKGESKPIRPPTVAEIGKLLRAAPEVPWGILLHLALSTGARRGELCALRWSDLGPVQPDGTAELQIARSVDDRRAEGPTKTRTTRSVVLGADTVTLLLAEKERLEDRLAPLGGLSREAYIASTDAEHARPILPSSFSHFFTHLARDLDIPVSLHGLRHASATILIDAGVPLPVVSKRLGHARTSTTIDIYAAAVATRDTEAAAVLDRVLKR